LAVFYNEYDHLGSLEPQSPELIIDGVPYVLYAYTADNRTDGAAYGLELAMDWDVSARLHVKAAYAYFNIDLNFAPGSNEMLWSDAEDVSPRHQLSLRTSLDISDDVELDVWLRRVDALEGVGVDGYTEMDVRLGWRPRPDMEFCLAGRNLLHDHHQEFGTPLYIITAPTEVERSMYAKATLYF
jgi:iron complex outermembrane receptor protein